MRKENILPRFYFSLILQVVALAKCSQLNFWHFVSVGKPKLYVMCFIQFDRVKVNLSQVTIHIYRTILHKTAYVRPNTFLRKIDLFNFTYWPLSLKVTSIVPTFLLIFSLILLRVTRHCLCKLGYN